ncbi:MAG: tyrosine-type recombinase/integrase [Silvanigrellales bacterium]|jgi:integrase/recombinase XerD|nr:tyrosine-type recombinase/integrase [Silvanigrellales bacterium]
MSIRLPGRFHKAAPQTHDLAPGDTGSKTLARQREPFDFATWAQAELTDALTDVLGHFLLSLRSPNTRRCYLRDTKDFLEFLDSKNIHVTRVSEITERMLMAWQEHLSAVHSRYVGSRRRVVQSSVARKLSSVSSLLDFALKRKLIERNVADLLNRPKVKRESRTNAFTREEVRLVLSLCRNKRDALHAEGGRPYRSWALRYAVLGTLFSVGMRVDELCELRIGDIETTPEFTRLHMTAKGSESHAPIIHAETAALLATYLQEFRTDAPRDAFVFVRAQNVRTESRLTQAAVFDMVTEVAREAGITKRVSPHSCRATLATLLHNGGVPIGHIQDLLNHKQITTTALYIKKAEELQEAAATKINVLG